MSTYDFNHEIAKALKIAAGSRWETYGKTGSLTWYEIGLWFKMPVSSYLFIFIIYVFFNLAVTSDQNDLCSGTDRVIIGINQADF